MNCNLTSPRGSVSESKFNSLVCFDLETTGLPQFGPVKITEFALVGVLRSHLQHEVIHTLPRVLHKLIFTVYPQKPISYESSHISGLWNDQLEHIKPWNRDTYKILLGFLNLLPAPVCIVAHNGDKFDFPIFKQHIQQIGQKFPNHFVFVDSLPAFQKILQEEVSESSSPLEQVNTPSLQIEQMIIDMDSNNDDLMRAAEEVEAKLLAEGTTKNLEVTPNSRIVLDNTNLHVKIRNSINSSAQVPNSNKSKVRKCLFPAKKPVSFKLSDIYSHLYNHPTTGSHTAEGDAVTLLKCILKIAPEFLKYADNNNKTLNSI